MAESYSSCILVFTLCLLHSPSGNTTNTTVLTSPIVASSENATTVPTTSSSTVPISAILSVTTTVNSALTSSAILSVTTTVNSALTSSGNTTNTTTVLTSPIVASSATKPASTIPISTITIPVTPTKPSTQIWNKVVGEWFGEQYSFIIMVAAVGLCVILLIALIATCCRYRHLKKKTKFPKDLIINNDSAWINSNNDLLMWERNLRATEVNPNAAATVRPANEKRA